MGASKLEINCGEGSILARRIDKVVMGLVLETGASSGRSDDPG